MERNIVEWSGQSIYASEGDLAELIGPKYSRFIFRLCRGEKLQTHRGVFQHDDLIDKPWGTKVLSHMGRPFILLQPSLSEILLSLPRSTQVMYPKEIGFILVNMGIGPGQRVIEAGTGSGGLTVALAHSVGVQGQVISYEVRPEIQEVARKNLQRLGLIDRVILKQRDIVEGFEESGMDAFFLDVQKPHDFIPQVRSTLKPGGFFGCILPTANQAIRLLPVLNENHFAFIEICEILLRYYQADPEHFRPVDRMVAHTGFLLFARLILPDPGIQSILETVKDELE
jgi:tRNA (adenine57-N1/adenine58-N1)-methyltransferase catalytic subunit